MSTIVRNSPIWPDAKMCLTGFPIDQDPYKLDRVDVVGASVYTVYPYCGIGSDFVSRKNQADCQANYMALSPSGEGLETLRIYD